MKARQVVEPARALAAWSHGEIVEGEAVPIVARIRSLLELRLPQQFLGLMALRSETAVPLSGSVTVAAAGMGTDSARPGADWRCSQRQVAGRPAVTIVGSQNSTGGSSYLSR